VLAMGKEKQNFIYIYMVEKQNIYLANARIGSYGDKWLPYDKILTCMRCEVRVGDWMYSAV
jgi:hypothetical protein